ncbi:CPBP family intramembrane glutamic endopeptidase [Tenacibaculum amylolyticum]|uniref:CPBP family intramembrane glutamic endopeptidase n=1 Tax=Tenacibaculum amylolyticum TaxID=104269 RepID=UPI00389420E3
MSLFRSKILPVITIILLFIIWKAPLGLDYFEMIIAMLIVLLSSYIEFKSEFLKQLGFKRSDFTSKNILIIAPALALFLFLVYYFVLLPIVTNITQQPIDFSNFNTLKDNPVLLIISFFFIWISAAFGEEIVWRGYFMKQFVKFFGDGKLSLFINILVLGIIFGSFHAYQGITGQIVTSIIGMILAFIFYKTKYNLWLSVAIHGFFDTIALFLLYFSF